jgi:hypothetical protein
MMTLSIPTQYVVKVTHGCENTWEPATARCTAGEKNERVDPEEGYNLLMLTDFRSFQAARSRSSSVMASSPWCCSLR